MSRSVQGATTAWLLVILIAGCAGGEVTPTVNLTGDSTDSSRIELLLQRLRDPANGGVMVIGHRGCWREAPENSLAAIQRCIDHGVDMVEIDVRATADGKLVLLHDESLDRTTNSQGILRELSFRDIRNVRLRERLGGEHESITRETIPTLGEALLLAKDKILINLDVKEQVFGAVLETLKRTGTERQILMKERVLRGSGRLQQLPFMGVTMFMPILGQCDERAERDALVCATDLAREVSAFHDLAPVAYEIVFTDLAFFAAGVSAVKAQNARLWVNTMAPRYSAGHYDQAALKDPEQHWGRLVSLGADMIQSDRPEALVEYLRGKRWRGES